MRRPTIWSIALLAIVVLVAAGCGDDDDDDSGSNADTTEQQTETSGGSGGAEAGGAAETLTLIADPGGALKFDKTELTAKAGKVKIVMDNPSSVPHAVEVEGNGVEEETKTLTKGTADVTVDLKAGKYEFYCPVDGHKEAGMEGTLTVS
jgi:plastocyanin